MVVVAAAPKPNAADAVVLAPSEPNANPAVSSPKKTQTIDTECGECWVLQQLWFLLTSVEMERFLTSPRPSRARSLAKTANQLV